MHPDLRDAVENAYRVFSGERLGTRLNVCRCPLCFSTGNGHYLATEKRLIEPPLRDIRAVDLSFYSQSAHGWHDEMRYFLPRYLDLIARGENPSGSEPDWALIRLRSKDWKNDWPKGEKEAIDRFLLALLADRTQDRSHFVEAGYPGYTPSLSSDALYTILMTAGLADADLAPLLAFVDQSTNPTVLLHVAALIEDRLAFMQVTVSKSLDELTGPTRRRLVDWLCRPEMLERMEAAFFAADDPVDAQTFSMACAALESARGR